MYGHWFRASLHYSRIDVLGCLGCLGCGVGLGFEFCRRVWVLRVGGGIRYGRDLDLRFENQTRCTVVCGVICAIDAILAVPWAWR